MIRSMTAKAAWVGRTASMVFGLAHVMALVVGAASTAWSATGGNFLLGKGNAADAITRLAGAAGVDGPMLLLANNNADPDDTALALRVQAGEAPMRVNSDTKVGNLNADMVDGLSSEQLKGQTGPAGEQGPAGPQGPVNPDADTLDGKDSTAFLQAYAVSENRHVPCQLNFAQECYGEQPFSVECDDAADYPLEAGRLTNLDQGTYAHEIEADPSLSNLTFKIGVDYRDFAGDDITIEFLCFDADGDGATTPTP